MAVASHPPPRFPFLLLVLFLLLLFFLSLPSLPSLPSRPQPAIGSSEAGDLTL